MGWIVKLIDLIICIFEIYMLFDFYNAFLEEKSKVAARKKEIIVVFGMLVFIINRFNNTIINLIFVLGIYLFSSIILFYGNIYKKILGSIMATVVLYGCEFGLIVILALTSEELLESSMVNEPSVIMLTVISKLVTFIVFTIIKQLGVKSLASMNFYTFMMYMVVPVSSLGLMVTIMYCGIDFDTVNYAKIILIVFFILLLIGNASIFYGFNEHARLISEREMEEKNILKQKLQLESYEKLDAANNRYMTLLHDTNHSVKAVYRLLMNEKVSEAKEILRELSNEYERAELIEYSGNTILNAVLSDYRNVAVKNGIEYDVFVEQGFNVQYVDEIDLVAMLGNLLSNAFEAVKRSNMKKVKVKMFMQNDGYFSVFIIENTFSGEIVSKGEDIQTTKEDKKSHGLGITSVRNIADKYNGDLKISWKDGIFKVLLILEDMNHII